MIRKVPSEPVIVAGHAAAGLNAPMFRIASDLSERGHGVTVVAAERFAESVPRGVRFSPMRGRANVDDRRLPEDFPEYKTQRPGPETLNYNMSTFFVAAMRDQHAQLQELLISEPESRLVATATYLGAWPEALGAPGHRPRRWVAVHANPLAIESTDTTFVGPATPKPGEGRPAANRAGNDAFRRALAPTQALLESELSALGATTAPPPYFDAVVTLADQCAALTVPGFEFRRSDAPKSLHHVGLIPLEDPAGWNPPDWWPELDDDRPVVLVTQGTLANHDLSELVEPAMIGLAEENALVIAALGRDPGALNITVPSNARVSEFVPFARLLPHVDCLITNGGFGGTQHAIAAGVPAVVAGASEEKPAVAARVAHHGLGVDLGTGRPTPHEVRDATLRTLRDERIAEHIRQLRPVYAKCDALADIRRLLLQ